MLKFRCNDCDQKIGVPEEWAGHNVRCPRCRQAVFVPKVIDAVINPVPAAGPRPSKPGPAAPKTPLTPMPGLKGKTVAMPHPAVKARTVAKSGGGQPTAVNIPASTTPRKNDVDLGSGPKRKNAPLPKGVLEPDRVVRTDPDARSVPCAAPEVSVEAELSSSSSESAASSEPDPVVVSARRSTSGAIVTEVPVEKDFSSLFSDGGPAGVGHRDVAPISRENVNETGSADATSSDSAAPLSKMIDALGGADEPGVTSHSTVSEIVKGLSRAPVEEHAVAESVRPRLPEPEPRRVAKPVRRIQEPLTSGLAWAIGTSAMILGAVGLAFCVTPRVARFALPVGACGLILAVVGAVVPARRRGTEVALALGSFGISATGVALAIFVSMGMAAVHGRTGNLPMARVGDVEVRVASVSVVRPVVLEGKKTHTADSQPLLQVGIEVRNLANSGSVAYKTWGALRPDSEPVILQDNEGNQLKMEDVASGVPNGRPREFPASIGGHSKGLSDVLLFDVPPAAVHELYLQLPGANVQAQSGFNIRIPASMLRR